MQNDVLQKLRYVQAGLAFLSAWELMYWLSEDFEPAVAFILAVAFGLTSWGFDLMRRHIAHLESRE